MSGDSEFADLAWFAATSADGMPADDVEWDDEGDEDVAWQDDKA